MTKQIPSNSLIDQQPVDTLVHIHAVLSFLQNYAARSAEEDSAFNIQINTGLYAILKTVNEAIDYEIERLDEYQMFAAVKQ